MRTREEILQELLPLIDELAGGKAKLILSDAVDDPRTFSRGEIIRKEEVNTHLAEAVIRSLSDCEDDVYTVSLCAISLELLFEAARLSRRHPDPRYAAPEKLRFREGAAVALPSLASTD